MRLDPKPFSCEFGDIFMIDTSLVGDTASSRLFVARLMSAIRVHRLLTIETPRGLPSSQFVQWLERKSRLKAFPFSCSEDALPVEPGDTPPTAYPVLVVLLGVEHLNEIQEQLASEWLTPTNSEVQHSFTGNSWTRNPENRFIALCEGSLEEYRELLPSLFRRLNTFRLTFPSLRERVADISTLATNLLKRLNDRLELDAEALDLLAAYQWTGDLSQLTATLVLSASRLPLGFRTLTARDIVFTPTGFEGLEAGFRDGSLRAATEDVTRLRIIQALQETKGIQYRAAKLLGISRVTLYKEMKRHKLYCRDFRK